MVGGNGRGMAGRLGRALAFQFIVTQSVSQSFGRRGRASIGTSSGVYYFAVSGCWWRVLGQRIRLYYFTRAAGYRYNCTST